MSYEVGVKRSLNKQLKEKIANHRQQFTDIFRARYLEMMPSLIKYQSGEQLAVDWHKLEIALRNNYDVVIGETVNRKLQIIGYANAKKTTGNPADLFSDNLLRHGDIYFIIPKSHQLSYYKEISYLDDCTSGNFAVLRNKSLYYVDDTNIIDHYVDELAEIVLSRYSISMQVKISTLFIGEPGDETLNDLINDIYNGNPFIKATKLFDAADQIYHMQNDGLAQNFQELKREYQNKIGELNNMLGINSLAVEKSSGVSDEEAGGNRAFTSSNANIYLDGRNNGLKKLNKRYDTQLLALYNDEVVSEFSQLSREEETEKNDNPV